jgi:glycosyltransferase involved in cell wall biosynthesis
LRVLTFTTIFPNAARPSFGIFVYQRSAHLARRPGNSVHAIAPIPYSPKWTPWERWRNLAQVPREERIGELTGFHPRYFLLPKISMPLHGLLMFLGCIGLARRLHQKLRFDCIDAHFVYPDGFAAVLLGKALGLPVFVSARGTDITRYPAFRSIRPLIRWTLLQAAGVVAVSASLKKTMVEIGISEERIRVIPNGVDLERFRPVNRLEARRRLGLPQDAQIVVSVGALLPVKCHERLLAALAMIAPRHPQLRLYVVGEGSSRQKLEALMRELHMQDKVVLVGSRPNEELGLWFSAADISCLTSSREGWPNVISESIACGTPVVATRVGGVPEIVVSPDFGIVVEPNAEAVAAGLEKALATEWNRETLFRHAQQRSWDVVAAEVEHYFATTIGAFLGR